MILYYSISPCNNYSVQTMDPPAVRSNTERVRQASGSSFYENFSDYDEATTLAEEDPAVGPLDLTDDSLIMIQIYLLKLGDPLLSSKNLRLINLRTLMILRIRKFERPYPTKTTQTCPAYFPASISIYKRKPFEYGSSALYSA
jgi:hypothetical protein